MKSRNVLYYLLAITLAFVLISCSDNDTKPPDSAVTTAPLADDPLKGTMITGKILETLNAGGYTYVHLDRGEEKSWVAMPGAGVNVGDEISVVYSMTMPNFESKTLEKTFTNLIFASGFAGDAPKGLNTQINAPTEGESSGGADSFAAALQSEGNVGMMGQTSQSAVPSGSAKAVVPLAADIQVEKAQGENAYTVGEIYEKSPDLNGKKIIVKAKVVKVLPNIMGRNWLHVQDGSGDPSQKTHDLVVTTSEMAQQGDIVTIEGLMVANKDFGSGYKYNALLEDAVITR